MFLAKRPNSKNWCVIYTQANGKKSHKSTGTANRQLAEQFKKKFEAELYKQNVLGEKPPITLKEALELYVESTKKQTNYAHITGRMHKLLGYKLDHNTKEKYSVFGFNGDKYLHDITEGDLEKLKRERLSEGMSPNTVQAELSTLRGTISYCKKEFRVRPQLEFPKIKIAKRRVRFLSDEEFAKLRDELDPDKLFLGVKRKNQAAINKMYQQRVDIRDLVEVQYFLGCRISEAILPWSSVDFNKRTVRLYRPKVENESLISMSDPLYEVLYRRFQNKEPEQRYVFESHKEPGKPRKYSVRGLRNAIDRAGLNAPDVVKEKGGRVSSHTLRKTFACNLISEGVPINMIQKVLGHSDIRTTLFYADQSVLEASTVAAEVMNERHRSIKIAKKSNVTKLLKKSFRT